MPGLNSGRPIANIDQSGIAKGVAALGKGIENLGEGVAIYARAQESLKGTAIQSKFDTGMVGINSKYDQDQDYGTRQKRYEEEVTKFRNSLVEGVSPRVAETFRLHTDPVIARAVERQKDVSFKLKTDNDLATVITDGDADIKTFVNTTDGPTRVAIIERQKQRLDAMAQQGSMSRVEAVQRFKQWGEKAGMSHGMFQATNGNAEAVINEAQLAPGSRDAYISRVTLVESGNNPALRSKTSTAGGLGQFLETGPDKTWDGLMRKFRPDLVEGKTQKEIDDYRFDAPVAKEMLNHITDQNESILKQNKLPVNATSLYMMHFLGPKAGMAVLTADPKRPVADVLKAAVGDDWTRKYIEANQSVLLGKQAGTVVQWAGTKMGGADQASIYHLLQPEQQLQLIHYAKGVLHNHTVKDHGEFKRKVDDTEAEAMRNGSVHTPVGKWEFISRLGFEEGKRQYEEHSSNVQLGRDIASLANLSPEQTANLVERTQRQVLEGYTPEPGKDGFKEQAARQDRLIRVRDILKKEKEDDPADFAIRRLPAVTEANNQFNETINRPGVSPGDRTHAARVYADTILMEQTRVGIPKADQRIVSNDHVTKMLADFSNQPAAGGPSQIAAKIEEQARLWGDNWPNVYRSIRDKNPGPAIEVIGSLIDPGAARVLVDLQPHKTSSILKVADDNDVKVKEVTAAVRTVMVPFGNSTLGHDGRSHTLEVFQGQIEKLSAYYVASGLASGPTAAAELAYKNVIGHKYDFQDTYRVPKGTGVDMPTIAAGAWHAKALIGEGKFAIQPAYNDMGGPLSPGYLDRETARNYARDGVWVTAHEEAGLALVYKGEPVAMRDGKPLVLSWKDLAEIAKESPLGKAPAEEARAAAAVTLAGRARGALAPQRLTDEEANQEEFAKHMGFMGRLGAQVNQKALDAWAATGPFSNKIEDRVNGGAEPPPDDSPSEGTGGIFDTGGLARDLGNSSIPVGSKPRVFTLDEAKKELRKNKGQKSK